LKPNFEAPFESEEKSIQFTKAIEAAQSTHQAPAELGWFSDRSIVNNKADEAAKCASCDTAKPEAGSIPSGPIVDLPITSTLLVRRWHPLLRFASASIYYSHYGQQGYSFLLKLKLNSMYL